MNEEKFNGMINQKYCPGFKGFSGGMRGFNGDNDLNDFFTEPCEIRVFRNDLLFDEKGFIGRNLSASYAPKENNKNYSAYIAELKSLFDKYASGGKLIMPNITRSYAGKVL